MCGIMYCQIKIKPPCCPVNVQISLIVELATIQLRSPPWFVQSPKSPLKFVSGYNPEKDIQSVAIN